MKILVGYRGTNLGKDLLELAVQHAGAFAAEIYLITSLPGGEKSSQQEITEAEHLLQEAKKFLDTRGIKNETHLLIRGVTAGEDIVSFACGKQLF